MASNTNPITLEIDEPNELLFKVKVEGTDPAPAKIRLVCQSESGNTMSYMFNGKACEEDIVQFIIPPMVGKMKEGLYESRIEVLVENRCFVPVEFDLNFKKTVKVVAEAFRPPVPPPPKVTVTASPIVAKKSPVVPQTQVKPQVQERQATSKPVVKIQPSRSDKQILESIEDDDIRKWVSEMIRSKK